MKIVKAKVEITPVKAPSYTPLNNVEFTAAVCDDGSLVLLYMEDGHELLCMAFNRQETSKVRSALNKGGQ